MNANDVIESYVTDVAEKLPRKQRNDVAFELRSSTRNCRARPKRLGALSMPAWPPSL